MNIEAISESDWVSVIRGTRPVQFEFLALQLFLVNLRNRLQAGEISIQDCIHELKAFYTKFSRLPVAEKDFNKIARPEQTMTSRLMDREETARRIITGQSLMLAGEESLLTTLPPGNWIGGTIPYFMARDGGCLCKDKIFVTEIPGEFQASTHTYSTATLPGVYHETVEGTVSFIILPAYSSAHTEFALHASRYEDFALDPLVGWIAGIDLAMVGKTAPKVFCGGPQPLDDAAAVMRLKLPADRLAQINIINLFQPGDGDTICFQATGFSTTMAVINGQEQNFAEYLQRINADTRLPLVANYSGAMVNVSLKSTDPRDGRVEFYAPVVAGIEYKLASPVKDYVSEFEARLKELSPGNVLFSCNCILNYLYSKLEGHRTGALVGPATFGEIAYQLLNQTMVFVEIVKVASPESRKAGAELSATKMELSAAHEELQASELRFRALCESAPMGIFLTDASGRILYENLRCHKLCGVSPEEAGAGGDWLKCVHPHDLPGVVAALKACERESRDLDHEFRFVGPDGTTRWVRTRTNFLRSETGAIMGRIGTVEEISDRKQAEIELERLNQDLVRASREAGMAELASGVLHNVKNVMNSINVSAGVIASQLKQSKSSSLGKVTALLREHAGDLGSFITQDPKGKLLPQYLEQLALQLAKEHEAVLGELKQFEDSVQHIKDIVTTQQSYAKLGGTSETIKPTDLMEDALRIVSASLTRHGIQLEREYAANLPDITVEKHKVLQILVNFIRNAKDACLTSDRSDKKVALRATNGGEFVHLSVTDNGIGIPPENQGRLFDHGFTTKKDGHGFGLCSSARAVRELGGDIQVQSDGPGAGATFSLKLPLSSPTAN
ncbi:MAG: ATP-binding protein [Verrucomicrobiota bacterium]|jgi:PAS domain S-box-containing protein